MALVLTEARQVAGDAEWGKDASRRRRLNVENVEFPGKGLDRTQGFFALREEHRWFLASVFIHLHISSYIFNLKMMQQFLPKPVNVNQFFEDSKVCFHGQTKISRI